MLLSIYRDNLRNIRSMHSKCIFLGYLWLIKTKLNQILTFTGICSDKASLYMQRFKNTIYSTIEFDDAFIRGPGIKLQVDKAKLYKRKYLEAIPLKVCVLFMSLMRRKLSF